MPLDFTITELACHDASCAPPPAGTGGSRPGRGVTMIRGDIRRERMAISRELDAQGLDEMNPLRHIFESPMGNRVAVIRNDAGEVVGGVQFDVNRSGRSIDVMDMRVLPKKQGYGTEAFREIAKIAVENDYDIAVHSALESAKPFYMKLGAHFQIGHSTGHWTDETRDALAAGTPKAGSNTPYDEWIKLPLWEAASRPRRRAQKVVVASALTGEPIGEMPLDFAITTELRYDPNQPRSKRTGEWSPAARGPALPDVRFSEVKVSYRPRHPDGHADPGEIVWAHVPFEDDPKQGKDRPVLIIGRHENGNLIGVQLTSKGHHRGAIPIEWGNDTKSWIRPERLIQVSADNYRKEGAYVKKPKFQDLADQITTSHHAQKVVLASALTGRSVVCYNGSYSFEEKTMNASAGEQGDDMTDPEIDVSDRLARWTEKYSAS